MRAPDADLGFDTLDDFLAARNTLPAGAVGILLCESGLYAAASLQRLASLGAASVLILGETGPLPRAACPTFQISDIGRGRETVAQLNRLIDALDGRWILWHWNAEFFFFPFCETRRLADLTTFLSDERRPALYTYALDLYSYELPDGQVPPEEAGLSFDVSGYHAFPEGNQQLTVYGGLGWRFQEFAPPEMSQIGRASLFRASKGVHMGRDFRFLDPDYAAVACPWHNSPTGALMSLRRAYRVMAHPDFGDARSRVTWQGSRRFDWHSGQLLELGMIEPGQWF
ncbi:MAG: hypothetical protein AAF674_17845 [Pseudomonadota bacterium]